MTERSYANPAHPPYWSVLGKAFGGTTATYALTGPRNRKGLVRDIMVNVTTTMVGTTTVPEIGIGTAAGDSGALFNEYARFRLGTTAIAGYDTTSGLALRSRSLVTGNGDAATYEDFTGHVKLETIFLPINTVFYISLVKGVGGSPAGTADVYIFIDWF